MMRILIVEDDLALQTELTKLLTTIDSSISAESADNVDETISLMESQQLNPHFGYDLILADVSVQGQSNGFDLWKVCSKLYPKTYFVFMSGISAGEFLEKIKNDPRCPPFLNKPFTLREIKKLVNDVLEQKIEFLRN